MIPKNLRFTRFWTPPADTQNEHRYTVHRSEQALNYNPKFFKDKIVLDAGCGWGDASRFIKVQCNAKQVIGIDLNPTVLAELKLRYKDVDGLSFQKQNIYDTSFEDNMFDIIVCTEVIEHIDTDELILLLTEWKRILKPDGTVWISTPRKRFDKKSYPDGNGSHWIEYDEKELTQLFIENNFRIVEKNIGVVMFFMIKPN